MAELAIPKRFKAVDGDANEYHRGTGKDVVKIRKTSKAGFHSCSVWDRDWETSPNHTQIIDRNEA